MAGAGVKMAVRACAASGREKTVRRRAGDMPGDSGQVHQQ